MGDDALGEREPQSPATALGGVSGLKDALEILASDALAGVGNFDKSHSIVATDGDSDRACAVHGIDSVLDKVFHHPLK